MAFHSGGTRNGVLISRSEKQFILEGCRDNCRQDGRSRGEFRSYSIVSSDSNITTAVQGQRLQPPLVLSNGSARLLMPTGETDIVCSVRAELAHPALERPNSGVLEIHVDTTRKSGRNNALDELESTLSRLLSNHLVDLDQLCISPSHYAWRLHVDLLVAASSGGSLVDACRCDLFTSSDPFWVIFDSQMSLKLFYFFFSFLLCTMWPYMQHRHSGGFKKCSATKCVDSDSKRVSG